MAQYEMIGEEFAIWIDFSVSTRAAGYSGINLWGRSKCRLLVL